MSQKILDESTGEEVEVFTAAEVAEREEAAKTAVKGEYEPKLTELGEKLTDVEGRLKERTGEFATFRKLSDDAVAKLGVAERTIYENGLALEQERQKNADLEKSRHEDAVKSVITAKANGNAALADEMTKLWPIIGIQAATPEEIESKAKMVLGALSTTHPDLVAVAAGFQGGSYVPPAAAQKEGESFADTEKGKQGAAELGLTIEAPKQ